MCRTSYVLSKFCRKQEKGELTMTYVGITVMVLAIEFGFVGAIAVGFYMYDKLTTK